MNNKILLLSTAILFMLSCKTVKKANLVLAPTEKPTEIWSAAISKWAGIKYKNLIATDSIIYVVKRGGLMAFDLNTRKIKWEKSLEMGFVSSDAILQDGLLMFLHERSIDVFDAETGKRKWYDFDLIYEGLSSKYGKIYFEDESNEKLHCIDNKTGRVIWKRPILFNRDKPLVADSIVINPSSPEAFNAINGKKIVLNPTDSAAYRYKQAAIGEGAITYLCLQEKYREWVKGYAVCFDYKGNEKWRFKLQKTTKSTSKQSSIICNNRVYVFLDKTYVLDLATGKLLWTSDIAPKSERDNVVATSNALLILNNKVIYALNAKTGTKMWELKPEDKESKNYTVLLCPNIIDKTIYVLCGKKIMAFK